MWNKNTSPTLILLG